MYFQILDNAVTVTQFKLLFTPAERIASRELAKTDAVVADMYELLDDQRTTHVNLMIPQINSMVQHLVDVGILTEERKLDIFNAKVPD